MAMAHYDDADQLHTEKELRKVISSYPKILDKRIRGDLDHYCLELINYSKMIVCAFSDKNISIKVFSQKDIHIVDSQTISLSSHIELDLDHKGSYISFYFLVPGIGHGLRVNGFIHRDNLIKINNLYLHCARAAARAQLWQIDSNASNKEVDDYNASNKKVDDSICPDKFLELSSYLLIKTMSRNNETELSPRGDENNVAYALGDGTLFIPERPGNKVAISLRNILENDRVELIFFIAERNLIMIVQGKAVITKNAKLLKQGAINGKRPKLGTLITQCQFNIQELMGLKHDSPWEKENHIETNQVTKFSKALSAHMTGEGLLGKASAPVIDIIVKNDMKHLY